MISVQVIKLFSGTKFYCGISCYN